MNAQMMILLYAVLLFVVIYFMMVVPGKKKNKNSLLKLILLPQEVSIHPWIPLFLFFFQFFTRISLDCKIFTQPSHV